MCQCFPVLVSAESVAFFLGKKILAPKEKSAPTDTNSTTPPATTTAAAAENATQSEDTTDNNNKQMTTVEASNPIDEKTKQSIDTNASFSRISRQSSCTTRDGDSDNDLVYMVKPDKHHGEWSLPLVVVGLCFSVVAFSVHFFLTVSLCLSCQSVS